MKKIILAAMSVSLLGAIAPVMAEDLTDADASGLPGVRTQTFERAMVRENEDEGRGEMNRNRWMHREMTQTRSMDAAQWGRGGSAFGGASGAGGSQLRAGRN